MLKLLSRAVCGVSLGVSLLVAKTSIGSPDVLVVPGRRRRAYPFWPRNSRGLEPQPALVYNSGGSDGIAGVGWSLVGFPYLERQGANGGSPQYDSADSYNLGGEDLKPCGTSSNPGCLAGGTHFTKHESYERISYDAVADEWLVESRNGTRSLYTPLVVATGGTPRKAIDSRRPTPGGCLCFQ
jgi:hypothetical protein